MNDYWEALVRLIEGRPINVSKHSAINKDTVALEAGRKRGSIKKSRKTFSKLIKAIETASISNAAKTITPHERLSKQKEQTAKYKKLYLEALNRELMLHERLADLEKKISKPVSIV